MTFGEKLRAVRVLRGWSQAELAEISGIERTVINRYESKGGEPRNEGLVALVKALCVSSMWLIGGEAPFCAVFRPLNPYMKKTPPVLERALSDIKGALPALLNDMNLTERRWYSCGLGRILVATGSNGAGVMVICTADLAAVLSYLDYPHTGISDEQFVALLFNPIDGLKQPDIAPELQYFQNQIGECWNMYLPQKQMTKVCFSKEGVTEEEIKEVLNSCFPGGVQDLKIETTPDVRENLPTDLKRWLVDHNRDINTEGRIIGKS